MKANKEELRDIINNEKKVLVFFYNESCYIRNMLIPKIKQGLTEEKGIKYVEVNTDEEPELVDVFGVTAYPFVITFQQSKVLEASATSFYTKIEKMIGKFDN